MKKGMKEKMTGNFEKAMDKLRDEMAKHHENGGLCALGEYMTALLQARPDAADCILDKKSLSGAWDALVAHAKKLPRSGSCVAVRDEDAFRICREYFGIADAPEKPEAEMTAAPAAQPLTGNGLDDLMGW